GRQSNAGRNVRRRAPEAPAQLPAATARAEALLLEKREVDPRPGIPRPRHPGLLGALRLQQRRRPLERGALQRVAAVHRGPARTLLVSTSGGSVILAG